MLCGGDILLGLIKEDIIEKLFNNDFLKSKLHYNIVSQLISDYLTYLVKFYLFKIVHEKYKQQMSGGADDDDDPTKQFIDMTFKPTLRISYDTLKATFKNESKLNEHPFFKIPTDFISSVNDWDYNALYVVLDQQQIENIFKIDSDLLFSVTNPIDNLNISDYISINQIIPLLKKIKLMNKVTTKKDKYETIVMNLVEFNNENYFVENTFNETKNKLASENIPMLSDLFKHYRNFVSKIYTLLKLKGIDKIDMTQCELFYNKYLIIHTEVTTDTSDIDTIKTAEKTIEETIKNIAKKEEAIEEANKKIKNTEEKIKKLTIKIEIEEENKIIEEEKEKIKKAEKEIEKADKTIEDAITEIEKNETINRNCIFNKKSIYYQRCVFYMIEILDKLWKKSLNESFKAIVGQTYDDDLDCKELVQLVLKYPEEHKTLDLDAFFAKLMFSAKISDEKARQRCEEKLFPYFRKMLIVILYDLRTIATNMMRFFLNLLLARYTQLLLE
jgi:hypothetical protein